MQEPGRQTAEQLMASPGLSASQPAPEQLVHDTAPGVSAGPDSAATGQLRTGSYPQQQQQQQQQQRQGLPEPCLPSHPAVKLEECSDVQFQAEQQPAAEHTSALDKTGPEQPLRGQSVPASGPRYRLPMLLHTRSDNAPFTRGYYLESAGTYRLNIHNKVCARFHEARV